MGATGRAYTWERQLPSTSNCAVECVARSIRRFAGEPGVRTYVVVESGCAKRTRGRYGANARFAVAKRAMAWCLYLQRRACGHGRGDRLALSTPVHYSFVKSDHCAARIGRKLFGCTISAAGAWASGMNNHD